MESLIDNVRTSIVVMIVIVIVIVRAVVSSILFLSFSYFFQ